MNVRITPVSQRGANLRLTPEIRGDNIIAVLPHGATVQAEPDGQIWFRVPITQQELALQGAHVRLLLRHLFVHRTAVRVLQAQRRVGIGLHLLNPQASDAGRVALQAYEAGIRHYTIIDDTDFARALADRMAAEGLTFGRDAGVVFRWWVGSNPYTPRQFADYFAGTSLMITERGERKMHPLIAVVGHNEADVYGCWSAEHLRVRMPFERELAQRVIGDLGGRYAMVSFAVGNPDILSHDVERVWRNEYLPWVNALATTERLLIDYHSYYPHAAGLEQIARTRAYFDEHTPWHTNRWHWFYEVGTDTRVKTISSETGLDEHGRGGFNTGVFHLVKPWAEYFRVVTDAPLRNGAPSPFLFGTVFCVADDRWRGYDVRAAWRELL